MKFSQSWLSTFFANNQLPDEFLDDKLADKLTMNGLEVEELYPAVPEFSNVVVAKIVSAQKHPDADKLRVCTVDIGDGNPLQIVCGAPNARENIYVPCAKIGAVLNTEDVDSRTIKDRRKVHEFVHRRIQFVSNHIRNKIGQFVLITFINTRTI